MIISVLGLKELVDVQTLTDAQINSMLNGIEQMIRKETNNNFQNRNFRFNAPTNSKAILSSYPYIKVGDTIQISQSINNGLYVVTSVEDDVITLDKELYASSSNLITKVEYGEDVKQGVVNLIKWEISMRDKVGIASETISRHSVTYFSQDGENTLAGYPKALLGFLEPYYKARF